jgi:hypothetical protein
MSRSMVGYQSFYDRKWHNATLDEPRSMPVIVNIILLGAENESHTHRSLYHDDIPLVHHEWNVHRNANPFIC